MEVRFLAEVTSLVRDRGRILIAATAVALSAALVSAPVAFGAGDPIASGTFNLKLSGGFKKQLKKNKVSMKPKKIKIGSGSNLDPTTGQGRLRLGKVTFKKGGKKIVFKNLKATLGANGGKGNITGNADGTAKIFSLRGGKLARDGFGADLTGVKVKFLKGAAKRINRALDLNSLKAGKAGTLAVSEEPKTVGVTGGVATVDIPTSYFPGQPDSATSVTGKLPSHCVNPVGGVVAIAPAILSTDVPVGTSARLIFPVTGGTIGPSGTSGAVALGGGIRLQSGAGILGEPMKCLGETPGAASSQTTLETAFSHPPDADVGPNLGLQNIQSYVTIGGVNPGCNFDLPNDPPGCGAGAIGGPGFKGPAIGQVIDPAGGVVTADPNAKTVSVNKTTIKINALTAQTLNLIFPNATSPYDATKEFADGDRFGISNMTVNTR
jgi:hypothetical protein